MSLSYRVCDLGCALADLALNSRPDAVLLEEGSRALSCFNVEAEVVEAADEGKSLLLVRICDGNEYRTVVLNVQP